MASVSHQTVARPAIAGQLQRKCACGAAHDEDDMCEDCKARAVQKKLAVGASEDPLELEADRIAEDVVSGSRHPTLTGSSVRAQRTRGSRGGVIDAPASVDATLASPATALNPLVRADMERRFGYDFSDVRVHADAAAARSARDLSAHAYTVGRHIVFDSGRLAPETPVGRRLLAHELTHVIQQGFASGPAAWTVAREPDDDEEELKRRALANRQADAGVATPDAGARTSAGGTQADAGAATTTGTGAAAAQRDDSGPAVTSGVTTPAPAQPSPSTTAVRVTPGGHTAAPSGLVPCPDAPQKIGVVFGCTTPAAAAPPAAESVTLPALPGGRFGGDAERAKFAKELAQCRAARVVNGEIEKRFNAAVAAAKQKANTEAKAETEAAIKEAVEAVDPSDKKAIAKAKTKAAVDAKKAAATKIADAAAAVKREDVTAVTTELAAKFESALASDFDAMIQGTINANGAKWRAKMLTVQKRKREQISKEKSAKPKVPKGETPPPAKTAAQIAAEIEAEMTDLRCNERQWARQQLENFARAWAVGRREEVDFDTVSQKVAWLTKFRPTYDPSAQERVELPAGIRMQEGMVGVAPELSAFLTQLKADASTPAFKVQTRPEHGGGSFKGKGFSVDIDLTNTSTDQRGFWWHDTAVAFLLRLNATAKAMGARWEVLYNDFRVAQEVNAATGTRNVIFIGKSAPTDLNWHGPAPLILHFHLDLEIPKKPPPAPTGSTP